jgi:putative hydrolase of the HAD superfamily
MRLDGITTLTFDVVGTLIDYEAGLLDWYRTWLRRHRERHDDAAILDGFATVTSRLQAAQPSAPYTTLLPRIHEMLADGWGLDTDESDALDLRDSIRDWPAHGDAIHALRQLHERFRLVAVTNADAWALEQTSRTLGDPFDDAVTSDAVGANKPDPRVWQFLLERLDLPRDRILHCAQSPAHDLVSAQSFGLATAWIDRGGRTARADPQAGSFRPDIHVHDLAGLVERLETGGE